MERQCATPPSLPHLLRAGLRTLVVLLVVALAALPRAASAVIVEAEEDTPPAVMLVMVEEAGCIYCARWKKDVGAIYPKTPEGRAAPLRMVDIGALPEDLEFDRSLQFTPTFVLMRDGVELNRLEGYPGEDFFWALLGQMLEQEGIETVPGTSAERATNG